MMLRPCILALALSFSALVSQGQTPDGRGEIEKLAQAYVNAVNAGDAKQAAKFWADNGDYTGPDGATIRGREALEKDFAEQFKSQPKAMLELKISSARTIGTRAATAEGTCLLKRANAKEPVATQFSALFVREDDGWRVASVREWIPEASRKVALKDLEWIIGDWVAKNDGKELRTSYKWNETKTFIHEDYTLTKDGKVVASGMQIIGETPRGGLRSWLFDRSGTTGESYWNHDAKRWLVEAIGVLPNGSETTAVNVLVPISKDQFTWQSTLRTAGGVPLEDTPPIKVTRLQK